MNKKMSMISRDHLIQGKHQQNNVIGNWWSHKILQSNSQISPISGSIKEQVVTFIGQRKIRTLWKIL